MDYAETLRECKMQSYKAKIKKVSADKKTGGCSYLFPWYLVHSAANAACNK